MKDIEPALGYVSLFALFGFPVVLFFFILSLPRALWDKLTSISAARKKIIDECSIKMNKLKLDKKIIKSTIASTNVDKYNC